MCVTIKGKDKYKSYIANEIFFVLMLFLISWQGPNWNSRQENLSKGFTKQENIYAAVPFSFSKLNFLPFARSFIEEKCQRTGLREMDILQLHLVEQKIRWTDLLNCRDPVSEKVYPFDSTNLNICFDALILVSFFAKDGLCNDIISRARKIVSVDWL